MTDDHRVDAGTGHRWGRCLMARRRRAAHRRRLVAAALTVLLLPVGTVAIAVWAQVPSNERLFLAYVVVCLIVPTVTLVALMFGAGYLIRACARALAGRRDRRIKRHVDAALAHLADPPTQVIQLEAEQTELLDRYDLELSDPTEQYLYPGDYR